MAAVSDCSHSDAIARLKGMMVNPIDISDPNQAHSGSGSDSGSKQPSTPIRARSFMSCSHYYSTDSNSPSSSAECTSDEYSGEQEQAVPLHVPERFSGRSTLARPQRDGWNNIVQLSLMLVACLCWVGVSSAAILINKHIMVDLSFHFPAAVAALGMLGTTVASFLACAVFRLVPCKATVTPYFFFTCVLSTAFFTALSFQAGNTAYLYLSVAFVQMLKSFTPVSTMLCGFAFKLERPTARLIAAVCCICCGVFVSSYGEVNFSTFGVLAMMTSIAAEGLRIVMMQHMLAIKQFHPLEAWMYLGPACCIWLVVLIGVFEAHHIQDQHGLAILLANPWYFVFAAVAGFAVNALAMVVIKLASALTLKVLGICKDIGLVVFGVMLLGEHISSLQVCGYSVSLLGFGLYNYIKAVAAGDYLPDSAGKGQQQLVQPLLPPAAADKAKLPRTPSPLRRKQGMIGTAPAGMLDSPLPRHLSIHVS